MGAITLDRLAIIRTSHRESVISGGWHGTRLEDLVEVSPTYHAISEHGWSAKPKCGGVATDANDTLVRISVASMVATPCRNCYP